MNFDRRIEEVREEYLLRMTRGNEALLRQVEDYVTARFGKMLRPRLLLAAAATLGDEAFDSRRTLLLATCVEMLHNASLLHDDVVDEASERRGRDSVNHHWNNQIAVLVGDYHLAQISLLLAEVGDSTATAHINDTVLAMVESELLAQEVALGLHPLDSESYLRIIDGKTARLFATACALGNPAYEEYGLHYGRLFQLRDDIDDGDDNAFTQALIRQEEDIIHTLQPLNIPNL